MASARLASAVHLAPRGSGDELSPFDARYKESVPLAVSFSPNDQKSVTLSSKSKSNQVATSGHSTFNSLSASSYPSMPHLRLDPKQAWAEVPRLLALSSLGLRDSVLTCDAPSYFEGYSNFGTFVDEHTMATSAPYTEAQSRSSTGTTSPMDKDIPSMEAILKTASQRGIHLEVQAFGPFFSVTAKRLACPLLSSTEETSSTQEPNSPERFGPSDVLGRAEGFIRPWIGNHILHLDTIRMTKIEDENVRSVYGVALLIGAVAFRYGYDNGCKQAQLLAIHDSEEYHEKLVKYYSRLGMTRAAEVTGGSARDVAHMVIWGGIGTRMDGDIEGLLKKWSRVLRGQARKSR